MAQLKRITRSAGLEFALRVGSVIIHHFYDGRPEEWRARGPKVASFRRLAERPDLPLSAGALYRCVALFELCSRLHAASRWTYLGASHLRLVLGLDTEVQERILIQANENRWAVRNLHDALQREGCPRLPRGGRRPKPEVTKVLTDIDRRLKQHSMTTEVRALSSSDVEESLRLVQDAQSRLEGIASLLRELRDQSERAD